MKFKKMIIIINIFIITILFTSCLNVGSREVNDMGIVLATAVDMEGQKILLTLEVIIPAPKTSQPGSKTTVVYVQSRGDTIFDALRNATLKFDKKLFMAHNRIIIFGDEFARRGIGDYISFFINDNEPRESAYLLIAKDTKAYEMMGINAGLSDTPSKYLYELMENYEINSKSRSLTVNDTLMFHLKNLHPVISLVEAVSQLEVYKEEGKSIKSVLNVEGGAVFNIDKLVGYYSGDEMKGFNFIVNEFENGLIIFETGDGLGNQNKLISSSGKYSVLEVKNSKTKKNIELIGDQLHLTIDVAIKGAIMEDIKGLDLADAFTYNQVELACSNKVKEYITKTMDKAQNDFQLDTFGISNIVHIQHPDLWKDISDKWEGVFPDLTYTVNVKTDILRSGLMNTPTNIRKENR